MYQVAESNFSSYMAAVKVANEKKLEVFEVCEDGSRVRRWAPAAPVSSKKRQRHNMIEQTPDTALGPYFVSAIEHGKTYLMAGPYDTHAEALANVEKALHVAYECDGRAWFMAWGTVRIKGSKRVGRLTELGLI